MLIRVETWKAKDNFELSASDLLRDFYVPMQTCGLEIARQLLLGIGFTSFEFEEAFVARQCRPTAGEEPYTSFFETFRYSSTPLSLTFHHFHHSDDAGFTPCESHFDIGCITLTTASSIGQGMQIKHEGQWIDIEKTLVDAGANHVLVFAGELMDYMTRSKVPKVEHRVVMAVGSLPRYSSIFEVLPLPWAVVPRLDTDSSDTDEADIDTTRRTGKEVFYLRNGSFLGELERRVVVRKDAIEVMMISATSNPQNRRVFYSSR